MKRETCHTWINHQSVGRILFGQSRACRGRERLAAPMTGPCPATRTHKPSGSSSYMGDGVLGSYCRRLACMFM